MEFALQNCQESFILTYDQLDLTQLSSQLNVMKAPGIFSTQT